MIGKIENFLSDTDIKRFVSFKKILETRVKDNGARLNYDCLINEDWNKPLREIIQGKISESFPDLELSWAGMYEDYKPGGIHTDGYIKNPEYYPLGYTFLVPLKSGSSMNSTVVFRETSDEAVTYNNDLGLGSDGIVTYRQVNMDTTAPIIDQSLQNLYMKHFTKQVHGTVDAVFHWTVGEAMFWPRNRFHTSAWFPEGTERMGLIITTQKKIDCV